MTQFAFGHNRRLRCASDYKQVFDHTIFKIHQPAFLLLATVSAHGQQRRLGLVVAKKKVKRAHERNRLKRLMRESFRLHQHHLYGLDIVILPKVGSDQVVNSNLHQQLHLSWLKLSQLYSKSQSNPHSL